MHCLDTSLIGGKATCFGFTPGLWVAPSCFVALLLELALWQPRCLTQVSDCSRGDLLLFTSEVTFEDPPFLGFLFPQRETPLLKECLCLWAPYLALGPCLWHVALFPFLWSQRWNEHCFGSLGSEADWALSSPFISCSLKTKDNKTLLTESVILPQIWTLAIILEYHSLLFKSSSPCVPVLGITISIWEKGKLRLGSLWRA